MKINQILDGFPGIELASIADNKDLCQFMKDSPMHGEGLDLCYEREPSFFQFLKYQGDLSFVICAKNSRGNILLVASISHRMGYVNGTVNSIAYLSDLRVDSSRITGKFFSTWKKCMGMLISHLHEIEGIKADFIITAIMADNKSAKRSLISRSTNSFNYIKLSDYQMINIIKKWHTSKLKHFDIDWYNGEREELLSFMDINERKKAFGYTKDFLEKVLDEWVGGSLNRFLVARVNGEIKGCSLIWNPSPIKKIIIKKLPKQLRFLSRAIGRFASFPAEGDELKVEYMNFLNIEAGHESCLNEMVNFLFRSGYMTSFHSLAFADFQSYPLLPQLKQSFYLKTKLELYQVQDKVLGGEVVDIKKRPGFEISLV